MAESARVEREAAKNFYETCTTVAGRNNPGLRPYDRWAATDEHGMQMKTIWIERHEVRVRNDQIGISHATEWRANARISCLSPRNAGIPGLIGG